MPFLMGDVSASVKNIQPAGTIVKEMVQQAVESGTPCFILLHLWISIVYSQTLWK
jgi:hypothetical protein